MLLLCMTTSKTGLFLSSLNFCTRHSNASSKHRAYRTSESNLVKRKTVVSLNAAVVQLIKQEARNRENINNIFLVS